MEQMRKKYEYKQNLIGNEYQILPLDDRKVRLNVIGEIAQAEGFNEADNLYIVYDFMIPPWFSLDYEEIIEIHSDDDKRMEDMMDDWNKTASVTQATKSTLERGEDGSKKLVANFCFPFDLQMLVDEDYLNFNKAYPKHKENQQTQQNEDSGIRFPKFPILFMQLNSSDSFGRTKIEGYGYCHIPREPGFHEIKVQTWAPYVNLQQQIHSFFLGGSMKVKDIRKIAETSFVTDENVETRLNRYNVHTESKGLVKINFNVAFQSRQFKEKQSQDKQIKKLEKIQKDTYKNISHGQKLNQQSLINAGDTQTTRYMNNKLQQDNF